ncbi:MAG TPA: TIGR03619 family F420-dependent LLM class oxidoreductase [Acetobacteraceae bacterium]|nr:TIGR03619 family F420-dependent LLM class oxidoreductase [Acetobacteraceae bacterium]
MIDGLQIGFNLPISGGMADPAAMVRVAREGEALGFDYLTLTDHVAIPDLRAPGYPYSESGEFYGASPGHRHEQLVATSWIAAKTEQIRLVLAVMVVPHRPAVLAAKMLASIDVLSGGRLVVGIGAGWLKAEFDAVVTTPFAERGAVTDAYLDAFRTLWTDERPRVSGPYVAMDGLVFDPKPAQKPYPPIWVGGESGPSMRRAARIGNAWYPIGSNRNHLLDTLPRLEAGIARLRRMVHEAGRDPHQVGVVYRVKRHAVPMPPASDGNRRLFSGTVADTIADIRALRDLGVTGFDFDFEQDTADGVIAGMRKFSGEVVSQV